jgi:hypothetical protein
MSQRKKRWVRKDSLGQDEMMLSLEMANLLDKKGYTPSEYADGLIALARSADPKVKAAGLRLMQGLMKFRAPRPSMGDLPEDDAAKARAAQEEMARKLEEALKVPGQEAVH